MTKRGAQHVYVKVMLGFGGCAHLDLEMECGAPRKRVKASSERPEFDDGKTKIHTAAPQHNAGDNSRTSQRKTAHDDKDPEHPNWETTNCPAQLIGRRASSRRCSPFLKERFAFNANGDCRTSHSAIPCLMTAGDSAPPCLMTMWTMCLTSTASPHLTVLVLVVLRLPFWIVCQMGQWQAT